MILLPVVIKNLVCRLRVMSGLLLLFLLLLHKEYLFFEDFDFILQGFNLSLGCQKLTYDIILHIFIGIVVRCWLDLSPCRCLPQAVNRHPNRQKTLMSRPFNILLTTHIAHGNWIRLMLEGSHLHLSLISQDVGVHELVLLHYITFNL